MCCNFPTIKITEGNAFTLIFPLKWRSYVAERPIDEDIDVTRLTDVRVTLGGVEYAPTIDTYGVRIDVPATLARGTYDGLLTADYDGNAIRGAYESCVQIVAWNAQSNAQQYILGSPVATKAAYVLGYMPTDAEVEALKQELREQIAAAEQAEAEAIAEKERYAEALEHLDDIAKETSVDGIAGSIGTPATGQPSTLFAAIAAGGGGDAQEGTSQAILAAVQSGNVTAIAELLNNAHGLDALRALIAAIPTTAPATPQNVTDAKDAVIAALPSVSGLATEANATVNKQAVLEAIAAAETALQGGDQTATLTALKQAVAAIIIPNDYAKETTAQQAAADAAAAKLAAQGITGYALQGSDPTATNTYIKAAITPIAATAGAYNEGKPALATAISQKGVTTLPTDSLAQMADNVWLISQEILSGESVTGNAVFPQPYVWNLISEAYAHLGGEYNNMILAEFYKGYDTIELSGADAYYTCDGDLYEYSTTHTWHDNELGRSNRYVIYYFHDNYANFNIPSTSICPRRMVILGKIGNISLSANGRLVSIFNCGEISSLKFDSHTNPWGVDICITGIDHLDDGSTALITANSYISNIILGVKNITRTTTGGIINLGVHNAVISSVAFPELETITLSGGGSFIGGAQNIHLPNLGYIGLPNLKRVSINNGGFMYFAFNLGSSVPNLKELRFPSLEYYSVNGYHITAPALQRMYFDSLEYFYMGTESWSTMSFSYLTYLYIGYTTNDKTKSVNMTRITANALTDVELKDGYCKPINISNFSALTEENMYAHILQRLKQDEPLCGSGVTITLGQTNLDKLTSAESIQSLDDLSNIYGYTFA